MPNQDWLEVSVEVDGEAAEAVSEVLNRYSRGGAVIEHLLASGPGAHERVDELRVKAYLPAGDPALKRTVEEALWHLGQLYPIPDPTFTFVAEADWAEAWKAHYGVLHLGRRTVIVPRWQEYVAQVDEVVITLDPGMAFGTGTHPTTRLCLAALEEAIRPGMEVLDLGTGTGVLAIAAAKQGAASVLALDIDDLAVDAARENVAANGVDGVVRIEAGSLGVARSVADAREKRYDLALVNILARVICELLEEGLASVLQPGGVLIGSGIIDTQEQEVRAALERAGIAVVARHVERDWVTLVGRKDAG
ncbi:MAG: 50S ribosomal protein L11 methyltransferase [Anaerolineae bacterium]|nr:MAG: 50S ribosomal protein L11 methyltransferase [Anaerolineae bacterium]